MGTPDPQSASTPADTAAESNEPETSSDKSDDRGGHLPLSRRAALASVVGIGGLSALSTPVAGGRAKQWRKDRDADGQELLNLGALAMEANATRISSFEGAGLSIDANGVLNSTVTDTRTAVSDDGTQVVAHAENIDFGSNLTVTPNGDGAATVDATGSTSGVGASVFLSEEQSVSRDRSATVAFDQELYDDSSEFDTGTHAFTPVDNGTYHVESYVGWPTFNGNPLVIHNILVNGVVKAQNYKVGGARDKTSNSKVLRLNAGDEVTVHVNYMTGGTSEAPLRSGEANTYATFTRLG